MIFYKTLFSTNQRRTLRSGRAFIGLVKTTTRIVIERISLTPNQKLEQLKVRLACATLNHVYN